MTWDSVTATAKAGVSIVMIVDIAEIHQRYPRHVYCLMSIVGRAAESPLLLQLCFARIYLVLAYIQRSLRIRGYFITICAI